MRYTHSLFVFRRDLRLVDNTALTQALKESRHVIPCFIFDPRQCGKQNRYKSNNALQFMIESLQDLSDELRKRGSELRIFHGRPQHIISALITQLKIEAVFVNRDYTPFSVKRDSDIEKMCIKNGCAFHSADDLLLIKSPDAIMNKKGTPVRIFAPFYRRAKALKIKRPQKSIYTHLSAEPVSLATIDIKNELTPKGIVLTKANRNLFIHGGRRQGLRLLAKIGKMGNYRNTKDFPAHPTSYLSAHHKFGTISCRETAYKIIKHHGEDHELLRQLYWRDFFTYLIYHFPQLLGAQCRTVSWPWLHDKKKFARWCAGKTGYPFVDIGMQMLNKTGFMHNRMRMVAASFLTKTLHIDWRWGERYFAQNLIDYDPAVNNGNWQWIASTGCDAQPPFRTFSPERQMKKFGRDVEKLITKTESRRAR